MAKWNEMKRKRQINIMQSMSSTWNAPSLVGDVRKKHCASSSKRRWFFLVLFIYWSKRAHDTIISFSVYQSNAAHTGGDNARTRGPPMPLQYFTNFKSDHTNVLAYANALEGKSAANGEVNGTKEMTTTLMTYNVQEICATNSLAYTQWHNWRVRNASTFEMCSPKM